MPLESLFIELEARPLLRMLLSRFEENRPNKLFNFINDGQLWDRMGAA